MSAMNILFFVRLQAKMLLYGQLVFDPTHVILWARSEKKIQGVFNVTIYLHKKSCLGIQLEKLHDRLVLN